MDDELTPIDKIYFCMPDGATVVTYFYGDFYKDTLPVVMLHGNGERHENLSQLIGPLSQERLVIALDSRGQGLSTRGERDLSYEVMAVDLLCILKDIAVEKAHLIGFSDGGVVALLAAMCEPGRFASATVMGANLSPEGLQPDFLNEVRAHLSDPAPDSGDKYSDHELNMLMLKYPQIDPQSLAAIQCPVAVMAGEYDLVLYEETYKIAEAISNSSLTIVEGAPHDLPNYAPDQVLHEAHVAMQEGEEAYFSAQ